MVRPSHRDLNFETCETVYAFSAQFLLNRESWRHQARPRINSRHQVWPDQFWSYFYKTEPFRTHSELFGFANGNRPSKDFFRPFLQIIRPPWVALKQGELTANLWPITSHRYKWPQPRPSSDLRGGHCGPLINSHHGSPGSQRRLSTPESFRH